MDNNQHTKFKTLVSFIYLEGSASPGEIVSLPSGTARTDERLNNLVDAKVLERIVESEVVKATTNKRRRS